MNRTFCFLLVALLSVVGSSAGARRFTYVYEATTSPPGDVEMENWVTWKTRPAHDHSFQEVDFRHELEFGITNKLQAAIYLADWNYHHGSSVENGFSYTGSALELIYNVSNPVADPLGFAVYEEIQAGDRRFESESKLIAQKNFGFFVAAYNVTLEAAWAGNNLEERSGELQQSLGLSYEISPRFLIGAEALHEVGFPGWSTAEASRFFVGPNVSARTGTCWATATVLTKLTGADEEPDFQLRMIFGFSF
jgi:hypothetical protein